MGSFDAIPRVVEDARHGSPVRPAVSDVVLPHHYLYLVWRECPAYPRFAAGHMCDARAVRCSQHVAGSDDGAAAVRFSSVSAVCSDHDHVPGGLIGLSCLCPGTNYGWKVMSPVHLPAFTAIFS